jgi:tetratricopeptide (TPR) repeat protein
LDKKENGLMPSNNDELNDALVDEDEQEEKTKGGTLWTILVAVVIIAIWLVIFGLLIKMDVGGFGSTVLRPLLKDVPVINRILPDASDEEVAADTGYKYKNLAQAVERIKELEREVESLRTENDSDKEKIAELQAEVDRLKVFEENQVYFEEQKKKFDEEVVFTDNAPDISEYKAWYEQMDKENAADIYEKVLLRINYSEQVKDWADTYSRMEPAAAAAILEEMTGDIDLVSDILQNMKAAQRASILAEMDTVFAAKITKVMHPDEP